MKNKNFEKLKYQPFNPDLPDLFPIKTSCSDTTYITKLTDYVFNEIKDTLFDKNTKFILSTNSVNSSINSKKKIKANQELYYTLSYIRMTEYNDYKMNLAISFMHMFYTKSFFSRTYFIPIIQNLILHNFLEVCSIGNNNSKKVTQLKSTQKLINVFNKFENTNIIIDINDDSEYIEIRNDNKEKNNGNSIESWAATNFDKYEYFARHKTLTIKSDNKYFQKIFKLSNNNFIFNYHYHESFLKNLYKYYKTCEYGYNRSLEKQYNIELFKKYKYIKNIIKFSKTRKQYLNNLHPKIKINKYRIKPKQIYNNMSLTQGGRIYCHFVEEMPASIRKTLIIDKQPTSCLDFKSMHPSLLYYYKFNKFLSNSIYSNIDITKIKNIDNSTLKTIIKIICLISINAKDEKSAITAILYKLKCICLLSLEDWKFSKIFIHKKYHKTILSKQFILKINKLIEQELNWLYEFFYIGVGIKLMYIEYLIFRKIAESHFDKIGEYPISIHDGYVIKKSNINVLQSSITEICESQFKSVLPFDIEY